MRALNVRVEIRGDALDPERLTHIIGVQPSAVWPVGGEQEFDLDGTYFPSAGWWRLDTESIVGEADLRSHLQYLVSQLTRLPDAIAAAGGQESRLDFTFPRAEWGRRLPPPEDVEDAIGPELLGALERIGLRHSMGWSSG